VIAVREALILGAMMFGGPYVEDAESRRRTRYAVVSGLMVSGYTPDDAEHIGYFAPAGAGASVMPGGAQRRLPEIVPYEWFSRGDSRLLLLWLDESAFLTNPLADLDDLVRQVTVKPKAADCPAAAGRKHTLKIIGPASSTTLKTMIEETRPRPDGTKPSWPYLTGSHFLSTATASDERLIDPPHKEGATAAFKSRGIAFARLIGRDNDLMTPLIKELELRGVDLTSSAERHHIALVSESDTFYGRTLPEMVTEKVCAKSGQQCTQVKGRYQTPPWIHSFSYFRGLDGVLPQSGKKDEAGSAAKRDEEDKPREEDPLERAEQDSQVDYLRRLAGRIKARDDDLRRIHGLRAGGIRAVGVLGSDFYDKLLVLRAIRRQLPDAVFFTTDLDARLLEPREFRWTRNLVVVSSFALELQEHVSLPTNPEERRDLQKGIPPFRDSYQTATFYTTLMALRPLAPDGTLESCIREMPRAFEIGRRVAFDLSCAAWGPDGRCLAQPLEGCPAIHPEPHPFFPRLGPSALSLGVLASLLTLVLGYTASSRIRLLAREFASCYRPHRWRVFCAAVLATTGVALALAWTIREIIQTGRDGEPFSLGLGISIWPTEIIRLVAAVGAVAFLIKGWRDVRQHTEALEVDFFPENRTDPAALAAPSAWRRIWDAYAVILVARPEPSRALALTLWQDYRRDGTLLSRSVRVLSVAAMYLAAGSCLIAASRFPHVPYRGSLTASIDRAVLLLSVILLIVLIVAVSDAIRLVVRATRLLSKRTPTEWPDPTLAVFRAQLGWPAPPPGQAPDDLGLDRWIDIQFIARLTRVTGRLIYFPFIVLFLMIIARLAWFDDWDLPLGLVVVFAVSLFYAIICAAVMRDWAETARREAIAYLTPVLIRLKASKEHDARAEQLRMMIDEIAGLEDGAFAPITKQPAVRAVLASFGGAGGLGILQYLALGWW
jgi:hypothetical protein